MLTIIASLALHSRPAARCSLRELRMQAASTGTFEIELNSPGRLSLFVSVKKDTDGFHNGASFFQAIDFGDTLQLARIPQTRDTFAGVVRPSRTTEPIKQHCEFSFSPAEVDGVPSDQTNLVVRALALYRSKLTERDGGSLEVPRFRAHLVKRLPVDAGLGGAASNAATALFGANELCGRPASADELVEWGAELGGDVAAFLGRTGSAYATGRGVFLRTTAAAPLAPLPRPDGWCLYVVHPQVSLSTAAVFRALAADEYASCSEAEPTATRDALSASGAAGTLAAELGRCTNDLGAAAAEVCAPLASVREVLESNGMRAVLCGTGPCMYALGEAAADAEAADAVASRLASECTAATGGVAVSVWPAQFVAAEGGGADAQGGEEEGPGGRGWYGGASRGRAEAESDDDAVRRLRGGACSVGGAPSGSLPASSPSAVGTRLARGWSGALATPPRAATVAAAVVEACAALTPSDDEWVVPEEAAWVAHQAIRSLQTDDTASSSAASSTEAPTTGPLPPPAPPPPLPPQGELQFDASIKYSERAAAAEPLAYAGDAAAQHTLGLLYYSGVGGAPSDEVASAEWHAAAAAQGNLDALAVLGGCVRKGVGAAQDDEAGVGLIGAAAAAGSPVGLTKLGGLYEEGEGGYPQDSWKAVECYAEAAEAGSALGLFNHGWALVYGIGVARDVRRGLGAWRAATALAPDDGAEEAAYYLYEERALWTAEERAEEGALSPAACLRLSARLGFVKARKVWRAEKRRRELGDDPYALKQVKTQRFVRDDKARSWTAREDRAEKWLDSE